VSISEKDIVSIFGYDSNSLKMEAKTSFNILVTFHQIHPRDRILHISFRENFGNDTVRWFSQ
jgi:hypothetical protein